MGQYPRHNLLYLLFHAHPSGNSVCLMLFNQLIASLFHYFQKDNNVLEYVILQGILMKDLSFTCKPIAQSAIF